jgi:hypothetical protein
VERLSVRLLSLGGRALRVERPRQAFPVGCFYSDALRERGYRQGLALPRSRGAPPLQSS